MNKKHIFAISFIIALIVALSIFIIYSFELAAITVIAYSFIAIAYLRAKEFFNDRAPGKYYVFANYAIGFAIMGAILLVDYNLANHSKLNQTLFASFYTAEIITGFLFTVALFWADHKTHTPSNTMQKKGDIIFASLSTILFVAILVFSLIVDINIAL